jgi:hypothetical protein
MFDRVAFLFGTINSLVLDAISIVVYQCAASTLTERVSEIEALLKGMEANCSCKVGTGCTEAHGKDMRVPTVSTEALRARVEVVACTPHFKKHEKTL